MDEYMRPEIIWVFVALALFLLEFAIPGLIVFFFGVGALVVAAVTLFFQPTLDIQLIIFIVASVILLFGLRRWLKGIFTGKTSSATGDFTDSEEYVGERTRVKEAIHASLPGKVELHGTDWKAEADEDIEVGTVVEVVGRRNLALVVKRLGTSNNT